MISVTKGTSLHRYFLLIFLGVGIGVPQQVSSLVSPFNGNNNNNNNVPNSISESLAAPVNGALVTPALNTRNTIFQFAPNGVCINPQYFSDGTQTFTMRNVPGDGDCMFLAVALAAATSLGLGGNDTLLRAISRETRQVVAQVLNSPEGNLHIEGDRIVPAKSLLISAAKQEGMTPEQYLEALKLEGQYGGLQGGGPELTVLANVLRRPISIYEVPKAKSTNTNGRSSSLQDLFITNPNDGSVTCPIQCMGTFGHPTFADPCETLIPNSAVLSGIQPGAYSWHLHILVLNMPNKEKHACVLLPQTPISTATT